MLTRAGFGDDAALAHAHGEKSLAETIIYFMRAGVQQIFALQINTRAAEVRGKALGALQRRGPAGEIAQREIELALERRVGAGFGVGALEFGERLDQRFGHEAATVGAVAAARVGPDLCGCGHCFSKLFSAERFEPTDCAAPCLPAGRLRG